MPPYKLATPKAGDGISSVVRFVMKLLPILYEWHIKIGYIVNWLVVPGDKFLVVGVKTMSEEENWKKIDFVLPDKKEKKITGN